MWFETFYLDDDLHISLEPTDRIGKGIVLLGLWVFIYKIGERE